MTKNRKGLKKKSNGKQSASHQQQPSNRWVDDIDFVVDASDEAFSESSTAVDVRIVSWNVLAEAYLNRKSHRSLPYSYQDVVFTPKKRRALLRRTISKLVNLKVDILCLQEVDLDDVRRELEDTYVGLSTPTTNGGGAGGRADACCIYYQKEDWKLVDHQIIRLDDLATLGSTATSIESNLQGLQQSFLRRNAALLVKLEHRNTSQRIVVANAHLFWNPEYEYIKLCQSHYITTKAKQFANGTPVIMCGDLNSQPMSCVHTYLTKGKVNAKNIAPWNLCRQQDEYGESEEEIKTTDETDGVEQAAKQLERMEVDDDKAKPTIRYLCDYTLNRFTRWLRILGIDCALETTDEEIQRTKEGKNQLFHRCRDEKRTLITTSTKIVIRKDCPAGTYLVTPRSLNDLEHCLVHLLVTHGVTLIPKDFLSRCVVCNGSICDVLDDHAKRQILATNQAPEHLIDELEVYECDGCGQGYWWCDRPTSSASRVKGQATRLFELCLRGGVPVEGDMHIFDFVDIEKERQTKLNVEMERLDCVDWLKDEELTNPLTLESAYALRDDEGEIVGETCAFTNVTHDFVGVLDYVLFENNYFTRTGHLYIPTSFNELNKKNNIRNGHVLPSDIWPSDHLAVGAQLTFFVKPHELEENNNRFSEGTVDEPQQSNNDFAARATKVDDTIKDAPHEVIGVESHEVNEDHANFCGVISGSPPHSTISIRGNATKENEDLPSVNGATLGNLLSPPTINTPKVHTPRCACGCVPNILSLFEMAELRKQAKLKKAKAPKEVVNN